MLSTARHTSAHTSAMDGAVFEALAKTRDRSSEKASLPSSLHKVLQLSNNKKERAFSFSGKLPAPTILAFLLEIWEREPLPLSYNCN